MSGKNAAGKAKVYRFTDRRQAASAASSLVHNDKVQYAKVAVYPGLVYIQAVLESDAAEDQAWLKGVMAAGQQVAAGMQISLTRALEIYNTREGVKHFRGYSWSAYRKPGRSRRQKRRGKYHRSDRPSLGPQQADLEGQHGE